MVAAADGQRFLVTGGAPEVRPAAVRATDAAICLGVGASRRSDVELAIHEALANALEHGHAGRAALPIDVEVRRDGPTRVSVRIGDVGRRRGTPGPDEVAGERGRGRTLMRAGCDHLEVVASSRGTTVVLGWDTADAGGVRAEGRNRTR